MSDRERAGGTLRAAIRSAASEAFGAVMVQRPIPGLATPHVDVEPLAGVRAAMLAREVATGCVRDYATQARSDGRSWDVIAEALGLEQVDGPLSRGERAYLHVIEDRPLQVEYAERRSGRLASWRCGVCGQYVTDRGPFEAAPDNNETGHAPDCARHAAEIAAYRAEWGLE